MMDGLWSLLGKLFDHKRFYLAGALAGVTVIVLIGLQWMGPLDTPLTWLIGATVFFVWMSVINGAEWLSAKLGSWIAVRRLASAKQEVEEKGRTKAVEHLDILTWEQLHTLLWLKHNKRREFQGWHNDEILTSLRRLKLIEEHEETLQYYSRYVVPSHIWDLLKPTDEQIRYLGGEEPWKKRSKGGRI